MDQQIFLNQCKEKIAGKSLAAELSTLLGMNVDAAYRRIRGNTPLTYQEISKICRHYNLSFDTAINYQGRVHPFEFTPMFDDEGFDMLSYLSDVLEQMQMYIKDGNCRMTIIAMDLPYFRQFGYPHLARFKLFYWQRSVLNLEKHRNNKFDPELRNESIEAAMLEMYRLYHSLDSVEIWTPGTLDSTLKQIQYGVDSGFFDSEQDALQICSDLDALLGKLEREASVSKKTMAKDLESRSGNFELYQSDILLGTNTVQVNCDSELYTYVGFNSFNSLMSSSSSFSAECSHWIGQIRAKSTLLSRVSEKHRYIFFQNLRNQIEKQRNRILAGMEAE